MASDAVLKYLLDTNRPYSCADVTVNLRGAFTKGAVQKALDALSDNAKIRCKLYGKQKVYAALQPDSSEGDNNVEDYDTQLKALNASLAEKTNSLKTAETTLKNLTSLPTNKLAKTQIEEIEKRIVVFENKLATLRSSTEVIGADEKKKLLCEHEKLLKEYRKRKRISSEILDAILEEYPKSKKTLLEELCIETDEMVNFKLMSNT
ncbi:homologous-pairing protein 2 homolog [Hyposmocoma kahamanoa]|uniref:homologous-pairing protein 2 homolog n=1 Tax=Hyposmocoma kahamanoa TaxID=1477025 RepID=UPI000E6D7DB0|nr:homologous-pairing protein 2 homolog [Hyposmocoma kahamanoa]